MTAVTPGRVAYERWEASWRRRFPGIMPLAWDELDAEAQADWEAIATEAAAPVADELTEARELLEEIGVMAANAPEDGDSFGLLEQIAMRIAAADVPDSTPIDEWPDPENPVTGRTPGAAVPSDVRLDWHMTFGEWRQLYADLWQHTDTPYIARLIEAGKIPAPPAGLKPAEPQAAPRIVLARCPVHDGAVHGLLADNDGMECLRDLADTAEGLAAKGAITPGTATEVDRAREKLEAAEQEAADVRACAVHAFAIITVLARDNPAAQRQANDLRKRIGMLPSAPAGGGTVTTGQAAYEVWRAAVPDVVCNVPGGAWEDLPATVQAGFNAIAATQDAQPAPELRDAWDAARLIREQHGRLLDRFAKVSDGYRAPRLSGIILAREYRDAGLPVPERLSHLRGQL